jgi:hypothetical protein
LVHVAGAPKQRPSDLKLEAFAQRVTCGQRARQRFLLKLCARLYGNLLAREPQIRLELEEPPASENGLLA